MQLQFKNLDIKYQNKRPVYDTIASQYKKINELPYRRYVEGYTYFNILGDIRGKSILDLACGEGFYTRQLKQKGAARVVGVDISSQMIALAKQEEASQPLGIEYVVGDALKLGKLGSFDLVVACYLLNYAQTKTQLQQMCGSIAANLKPGGRFVSINGNLELPPEFYPRIKKYGYTKSIAGNLEESKPIKLIYFVDGETFSFDNYYLSQSTYKQGFQEVGLEQIRWHRPGVSSEGAQRFGKEFWHDFLDDPPLIGIECWKGNKIL
ncbi:MAG: hypothetical protein Fur0025_42660 [Oscillatoriaceae cyanobacterium]